MTSYHGAHSNDCTCMICRDSYCRAHMVETLIIDGREMCPVCVEENKERLPHQWAQVQEAMRVATIRKEGKL